MPSKEQNAKQADDTARKRQSTQVISQEPVLLQEQLPPLTRGMQRAVLDPGRASPADILSLQRLVGNRAVSGLIQAKLTVGPVGDRYEQEADRVAEQVVNMPAISPRSLGSGGDSPAQRQEEEDATAVQAKPLAPTITPLVQRQEEEEEVQMKPLPSTALRTGLQRQEEEEELQAKPLIQRQEEEEELQAKPLIQRQEEEEELQAKPLVQRQEEEEELQTKSLIQRQEEEEELQAKPLPSTALRTGLQRQEEEEELQAKPLPSTALRTGIQRQEEEEVQTKPRANGGFEAGPEMESRLAAHQGGGHPLPGDVRAFMEPRFGADFGGVRVHTGSEAVQMNKDLSAQAFTHGQHIYLGAGKYDPGTTTGKRLLAHELTHVVQQSGAVTKAGGIRAHRIQRFPANVLTGPIDWGAQDFNVRRSEGGAVAGVQFLRSRQVNPGDVPSIVLKMMTGGEAQESEYGEALLMAMNVNVPEGRMVPQGTAEFSAITQKLGLAVNEQGQTLNSKNQVVTAYSVMADLTLGGAKSLEDYLKEAKTEAQIDRVVEIVTDATLLRLVGRLAAVDSAMGNFDRITSVGLNYGNIMVRARDNPLAELRAYAIDTAANLPQFEQEILSRVQETGGFDEPRTKGSRLIRDLFDKGVDDLAERFLDGLPMALKDYLMVKISGADVSTPEGVAEQEALMEQLPQVTQLAGLLGQRLEPRKEAAMAHIRDGYGAGLTALAQLFSRANKASPQRQALKAQGQTPGVSWETLKAHVKYMGARAAGAAHQPVADVMASYAEYRLWKRQYPQRMTAIKTIDPALLQVPAQAEPEKLKKTQKVGRFFTVAWFTKAQKQAKELKKQARAGQIDPELEGAVQEAMAHQDADASRRARKAIHLAKLRRFLNALDARAEQMGQLHLEARSLRAQARGQGAPALFARKKLTYMGNRLVAADAADLRATFAGIKGAKQNWEQGLAGSERAMTTELRNRYDAFFNSLRQFALKVKPQEAL